MPIAWNISLTARQRTRLLVEIAVILGKVKAHLEIPFAVVHALIAERHWK